MEREIIARKIRMDSSSKTPWNRGFMIVGKLAIQLLFAAPLQPEWKTMCSASARGQKGPSYQLEQCREPRVPSRQGLGLAGRPQDLGALLFKSRALLPISRERGYNRRLIPMDLIKYLPPEAEKILLVLFLSFLIGMEREEHKASGGKYSFGGVRTFPLIGLIGYSLALVSGSQLIPLTIGFAVIGSFLLLSYWHKLASSAAGVTTEMSGLATFLVGALVCYGHLWIATTLCVASLLLLDLKTALEKLAVRIAASEILTLTKFLLLTGVILPVLPNQEFSRFHINPFKTWLVVVAISTISYASYVLQKLTKVQRGLVVSALLGGAYSSTATTVVLARRAARERHAHLFAGSILMASGMMYLRLAALVTLFNRQLMLVLIGPFLTLAALAIGIGWLWTRVPDESSHDVEPEYEPRNPLELLTAFLFALLFMAMLVATQLAVTYLGKAGIDTLAAIMGLVDVDPFIMGMTQATGILASVKIAAVATVIAAASNNVAKGFYAFTLADRRTGIQALALLSALAALGLIPIFWLAS